MPDLQILQVTLRNLDGPLPIQAVRLHTLRGVFYQALGGESSPMASSIHSTGRDGRPDPAPYSIGPLFADGYLKGLRIATFNDQRQTRFDLGKITAEAWNKLKEKVINVGSANMEVFKVDVKAQNSYEQLWDESEPHHGLGLRFEMPTRFTQFGRDHVLPVPRVIWGFYLLRWNRFSGLADNIPLEFLTWIEHQVHVTELTLETRLAYIDGNSTSSGVMGDISLQAFREKKPAKGKENMVPESQLPNYLRAWRVLALLGSYSGTGENANIGMGRTSIVSFFGAYRKE